MKKCVVVELKENYAIVLGNDGAMERIKIKDGMKVGQKLFYFDEDVVKVEEIKNTKKTKKNNKIINFASAKFIKTMSAVAALFAFMFTMFYNFNTDDTYIIVSLDINPSIQISADINQKILKIQGMNDDGKNIDFSNIKGDKLTSGIEKVKDILVEKKYLENNKDVLVAVSIPEENTNCEETIKDTVATTFVNENIVYIKVDEKEDVEKAEKENISLGRYEVTKLSQDKNIKQDAAVAPVKELTEQIKDNEKVIYFDNADKEKAKDTTEIKKDETIKDNTEKKDIDNSKQENKEAVDSKKNEAEKTETQEKKEEQEKPNVPVVAEPGKGEDEKKPSVPPVEVPKGEEKKETDPNIINPKKQIVDPKGGVGTSGSTQVEIPKK